MSWTNVKLIFVRELRDQLRDRRTLFTIVVLPVLLYPLMGLLVFQAQQFLKEHASKVRIVGTDSLPAEPRLIENGAISSRWASEHDASLLKVEVVARTTKSGEEVRADAQRRVDRGVEVGYRRRPIHDLLVQLVG